MGSEAWVASTAAAMVASMSIATVVGDGATATGDRVGSEACVASTAAATVASTSIATVVGNGAPAVGNRVGCEACVDSTAAATVASTSMAVAVGDGIPADVQAASAVITAPIPEITVTACTTFPLACDLRRRAQQCTP